MYKYLLNTAVVRLLASRWRVPVLKKLLRLHSLVERWVSTFAVESGVHVKHRLMKYHQFFVDNVGATDCVLDIGCGAGHVAYTVAQKAKQVVGIDIDRNYLAPSVHYAAQTNLTFIQGDATVYNFQQEFDVIILSNVLEHIDDRVALLQKIKKLAPKILIRVPMLNRDWLPLLKRELGLEYRLDPTHTIEYTEPEFRDELEQAGLTCTELFIRFGEIYCVATT